MSQCRNRIVSEIDIKHVILDCSCMNYVDSQGVETIKNVSCSKIYYLNLFNSFRS